MYVYIILRFTNLSTKTLLQETFLKIVLLHVLLLYLVVDRFNNDKLRNYN